MRKIRVPDLKAVLFVFALMMKPVYLGDSGTLQISDLVYVGLFLCFFIRGRIYVPGKRELSWIRVFVLIILYQLIVNLFAYFITTQQGFSDVRFLKFNLFYLFNFLVCLTVFQMYNEFGYQKLFKLYLVGTVLSVAVCYLGIILNFRGRGRVSGFFNNPNQLGYFAIIIMTVFVIYSWKIRKSHRLIMITLCLILNILSLSKASIVGSAVLLIMYALISSDERGAKKTAGVIILIAVVASVIYLAMYADIEFLTRNYYISAMRRRLMRMQYENDTNLGTGRGYDRLREIGLFIITGVGEGAYTRFNAAYGKELHSMYASIVVCYGLIGFAGYIYLFKQALYSNNKKIVSVLAFSGILLYCVTHNGVRNTLLWTLLAMLMLRPYEQDVIA